MLAVVVMPGRSFPGKAVAAASCRQEAHVSAMMDSERCRLLMRQMAWSRSSLVRPSSCSSCSS